MQEIELRQKYSSITPEALSLIVGSFVGFNDKFSLLDIGAGFGLYSIEIAKKYAQSSVVSVEPQSDRYELLNSSPHRNLKCIKTDAVSFIKANEMKFNIVLLMHTLSYCLNKKEIFEGIENLLNEDGILVFTDFIFETSDEDLISRNAIYNNLKLEKFDYSDYLNRGDLTIIAERPILDNNSILSIMKKGVFQWKN